MPVNLAVRHPLPAGLSPADLDRRRPAGEAPGFAPDPCRGSMWRYAPLLGGAPDGIVSLGEGATPLIDAGRLDLGPLLVKDESRNPTGSFKDRLASAALTHGRRLGARVVVASSSGNAGAAAAAYAARAGLPCVVLVARGANTAMVAQIAAYGAALLSVPTSPDRWTVMTAAVDRLGWYPVTSYAGPPIGSNPLGIDGYRTIAFEIAESLDWDVPDWCAIPACYGDSLAGMAQGFQDLVELGWTRRVPRLLAAEVSGSLARGLADGGDRLPSCPREQPSIAASIDGPQSTWQGLAALRATGGLAIRVDDAAIREAVIRLGGIGLHVEASSAATLPAIAAARADGRIGRDERVVALATSSGLKDLSIDGVMARVPAIAPSLAQALAALRSTYGLNVDG